MGQGPAGQCRHNNFDVIRIDFYQERQAAFEAFKKGEITFREEFTSITWATGLRFPGRDRRQGQEARIPRRAAAVDAGLVLQHPAGEVPRSAHAAGDRLAFDFEWTNRNLFYDSYQRLASYFEKSDFAATGMPSPEELKLLEPFRAELPPEVFGEAYVPPKSDGSGHDRKLLRQAADLLAAAGWKPTATTLVDEEGEPLEVEFLIDAAVFERVLAPYIENLKRDRRRGDRSARSIRRSTSSARTTSISTSSASALSMSATPLDGLPQFFASTAADTHGQLQLRRHQGQGGRRAARQAARRSARATS